MKTYSINEILPSSPESLVLYADTFEDTEDSALEWPHRHGFFSIVWFTHGAGFNVIDFNEHQILPNRIFTINPFQVHNWSYSQESKGYTILFDRQLAASLNISFRTSFVDLEDKDYRFVREIILRLIESLPTDRHLGQSKIAISYLNAALQGYAVQAYARNGVVSQFKESVMENMESMLTVEEYAERIGTTMDILVKECKLEIGLTPKKVQLDLKLTEAKRLLLYTDLNASEIAYRIGFSDTSYFSRLFKRKTGSTPTEFTEKCLKDVRKS